MAELQESPPEWVHADVASLLLDSGNPRLSADPASQREAVASLIRTTTPTKFLKLADDISKYGLNPAELPIATPGANAGTYVVLEGNRRLSAVKCLENPQLAEEVLTPSQLRLLRNYAERRTFERVTVVVFPDRASARHWLQLRHTGENGGAGVVPWTSAQTERFAKTGKHAVAMAAIEFVVAQSTTDAKLKEVLQHDPPLTNISRLLSDPSVQARLGITFADGKLSATLAPDAVARAVTHVIRDFASPDENSRRPVSDIYKKADRRSYLDRLPEGVLPKEDEGKKATIVLVDSGPDAAREGEDPPPTKRTKPRKKAASPTLFESGDEFWSDGRLSDIEVELSQLRLDRFVEAISVLFRVYIEMALDDFAERTPEAGITENDKLKAKLQRTKEFATKQRWLTSQEEKAVNRAISNARFLDASIDTMHQYIHNRLVSADAEAMRKAWVMYRPLIRAISPKAST